MKEQADVALTKRDFAQASQLYENALPLEADKLTYIRRVKFKFARELGDEPVDVQKHWRHLEADELKLQTRYRDAAEIYERLDHKEEASECYAMIGAARKAEKLRLTMANDAVLRGDIDGAKSIYAKVDNPRGIFSWLLCRCTKVAPEMVSRAYRLRLVDQYPLAQETLFFKLLLRRDKRFKSQVEALRCPSLDYLVSIIMDTHFTKA